MSQAFAALAFILLAGHYALNPLFRLLARAGARETLTAAALLIVLGAAVLMQSVGMSMALGAFLAGMLLSESNFRHQLEADIEPFRGLLMGLFFMSVGMSVDRHLVADHFGFLAGASPRHSRRENGAGVRTVPADRLVFARQPQRGRRADPGRRIFLRHFSAGRRKRI